MTCTVRERFPVSCTQLYVQYLFSIFLGWYLHVRSKTIILNFDSSNTRATRHRCSNTFFAHTRTRTIWLLHNLVLQDLPSDIRTSVLVPRKIPSAQTNAVILTHLSHIVVLQILTKASSAQACAAKQFFRTYWCRKIDHPRRMTLTYINFEYSAAARHSFRTN